MGTGPNVPQTHEEIVEYEVSPVPRWVPVSLLVLLILVGYALYAGYKSRTNLETALAKTNQRADLLAQQLDNSNEQIAELQGQLEVTSNKLGLTQEELARARRLAQNIRKEQRANDEQLKAQLSQVKEESETKIGHVATEVSGAKSDLAAAREELETAKGRLQRVVGDLSDQGSLIARNREELEVLKRLGERNIYEFDLRKDKRPHRLGPIQVALKKVDTKRYKFTMDVYADDKRIEKKDKTLNEPVQFYVRGARSPLEIVVFDMKKDRAIGYLSTPKDLVAQRQ